MSPSGRIWVHISVRRLKYSLKMYRTFRVDYFGQDPKIFKNRLYHRIQRLNLIIHVVFLFQKYKVF